MGSGSATIRPYRGRGAPSLAEPNERHPLKTRQAPGVSRAPDLDCVGGPVPLVVYGGDQIEVGHVAQVGGVSVAERATVALGRPVPVVGLDLGGGRADDAASESTVNSRGRCGIRRQCHTRAGPPDSVLAVLRPAALAVRDVVLRGDRCLTVPPIGDQRPALDGAEVDTGRVGRPVLSLVGLPPAPVVAVEDRLDAVVVVGRLIAALLVGEAGVGDTFGGPDVLGDLGQLPEGDCLGIPPSETCPVSDMAVLVLEAFLPVLLEADLRALQ